MRIEQKQSQVQIFAPQLRQSLKILQVTALELRDTILEELQSNPVLEEMPLDGLSVEVESGASDESTERKDELDFKEDYDSLLKLDDDWRDHFAQESASQEYTHSDSMRRQYFLDSVVSEVSLQLHLMEQVELSECTEAQKRAIEYLVGSLDDHGFIKTDLKELAEHSGLPIGELEEAREILKTFEPVGLGSYDVRECLLSQLQVQEKELSFAATIIRDHYPLLLRRRLPDIARKLGVDLEDVNEAIEEISALDPAPGRKFSEDTNRVVMADATVERVGDDFSVVMNSDYIPRLRISKIYKDLIARGSLSPKETEYIKDKMRAGKVLMNSIDQRQKTIERITRTLLERQRDFFERGPSALTPLTMQQLGDELGLHETTISRATAGKFLQTPHGLYPYKYFFTAAIKSDDGSEVSNRSIKEQIANIIESEPPEKPFSDQKIVEILAEQNINIARRTVAKYREELGILATSLRRKY